MDKSDPLAPLAARGHIAGTAAEARREIAAVHRKPAVLRKPAIVSGESAVRGAKLSVLIDGHPDPTRAAGGAGADGMDPASPLARAVSAYGMLAPAPVIDQTVATWLRAPGQVLSQLDVRAGGSGRPVSQEGAARLRTLLPVVLAPGVDGAVAAQVVHGEIAGHGIFGPRSGLIARVASRVTAVASGFDPAGLAVPEVHLHRHASAYRDALARFGDPDAVVDAVEFLLAAWVAGAKEARAIVEAA